jgi:phosphate transport system permease protein
MTSYIVQISKGDTPTGTIPFLTFFAVGATLFLITMGLNIVAIKIVRKYRKVYA